RCYYKIVIAAAAEISQRDKVGTDRHGQLLCLRKKRTGEFAPSNGLERRVALRREGIQVAALDADIAGCARAVSHHQLRDPVSIQVARSHGYCLSWQSRIAARSAQLYPGLLHSQWLPVLQPYLGSARKRWLLRQHRTREAPQQQQQGCYDRELNS